MSSQESNGVCFNHPSKTTYVCCSRCEEFICTDCMRPASIGYQCPSCAKDSITVIRGINKKTFISMQGNNKVTRTITILIVSIYLAQLALGDILLYNFALFAPKVAQGQWWLLFTAGFLHGSLVHLLFNAYILWVIGSQLEDITSSIKFIIIYFISLLGGSLASYLFSPSGSYSVGASGAIFGLMGAMLIVGRKYRLDISQITVLLGINIVFGFVFSGIDWRAHLGGLATGVLITYILINAISSKEKNQK